MVVIVLYLNRMNKLVSFFTPLRIVCDKTFNQK